MCAAVNHWTKHVAVVVAAVVRLAVAGRPLPQNQTWAESVEADPMVACTADKRLTLNQLQDLLYLCSACEARMFDSGRNRQA